MTRVKTQYSMTRAEPKKASRMNMTMSTRSATIKAIEMETAAHGKQIPFSM